MPAPFQKARIERSISRWFWKYDVGAGDEFRAAAPAIEGCVQWCRSNQPVSHAGFHDFGTANDFEMFETSLAIADAIRSFDLTFITGGLIDDMGSLYVDDISVALAAVSPVLAGDYNDDGVVDAADYVVWRKSLGGPSLPNETVSLGIVDQADYSEWRVSFGNTANAKHDSHDSTQSPRTLRLAPNTRGLRKLNRFT